MGKVLFCPSNIMDNIGIDSGENILSTLPSIQGKSLIWFRKVSCWIFSSVKRTSVPSEIFLSMIIFFKEISNIAYLLLKVKDGANALIQLKILKNEYFVDRGIKGDGDIVRQVKRGIVFSLFEKDNRFSPHPGFLSQFFLGHI